MTKTNKQEVPPPPAATFQATAQPNKDIFQVNALTLALLTLCTGLFYAYYSTRSDGFYQQDEAGHFISMLDFWHQPSSILSNWAKPGYKLIYVLPALLGKNVVMLLNCFFAAMSGWLAYKIAEKLGSRKPLLAMILLVTQPLWLALSFRNYSEIPSAFLLTLAVYLQLLDKRWLAALVASYICTIRQEFIPILGLYGLYALYRKDWLVVVMLTVFPLLQNLWGGLLYNDPLYLLHQVLGTSEGIQDAYPRQGFDHYWRTSVVIFGAGAVTLLVAYIGTQVLQRKQPVYLLLAPVLLYMLVNSIFNWQAVHFGPSTGGNLRYMLFVAPLVAVLGTLAVDEYEQMPDRWRIAYFLVPLAIVVALYLNHKHNYVLLQEESDPKPLMGVMLAAVVLLLPMSAMVKTSVFGVVLLFNVYINSSPMKMSDEDRTCRDVANWYKQNQAQFKDKLLYVNHVMFFYFLEKTRADLNPEPKTITNEADMQAAPKGSFVFWDSHYGFRPNLKRGVNIDYFLNKPTEYTPLQQFITPQQNFGFIILEKK